jgi:hypothetical protein
VPLSASERLFSSSKKFATLEVTHAEYCAALRDVSEEKLESILAAEVLKLSFIRQMKTDRLGAFAKLLIMTVIFFTALMFIARKIPSEPNPQPSRIASPWPVLPGPRDVYNFNSPQPKPKH